MRDYFQYKSCKLNETADITLDKVDCTQNKFNLKDFIFENIDFNLLKDELTQLNKTKEYINKLSFKILANNEVSNNILRLGKQNNLNTDDIDHDLYNQKSETLKIDIKLCLKNINKNDINEDADEINDTYISSGSFCNDRDKENVYNNNSINMKSKDSDTIILSDKGELNSFLNDVFIQNEYMLFTLLVTKDIKKSKVKLRLKVLCLTNYSFPTIYDGKNYLYSICKRNDLIDLININKELAKIETEISEIESNTDDFDLFNTIVKKKLNFFTSNISHICSKIIDKIPSFIERTVYYQLNKVLINYGNYEVGNIYDINQIISNSELRFFKSYIPNLDVIAYLVITELNILLLIPEINNMSLAKLVLVHSLININLLKGESFFNKSKSMSKKIKSKIAKNYLGNLTIELSFKQLSYIDLDFKDSTSANEIISFITQLQKKIISEFEIYHDDYYYNNLSSDNNKNTSDNSFNALFFYDNKDYFPALSLNINDLQDKNKENIKISNDSYTNKIYKMRSTNINTKSHSSLFHIPYTAFSDLNNTDITGKKNKKLTKMNSFSKNSSSLIEVEKNDYLKEICKTESSDCKETNSKNDNKENEINNDNLTQESGKKCVDSNLINRIEDNKKTLSFIKLYNTSSNTINSKYKELISYKTNNNSTFIGRNKDNNNENNDKLLILNKPVLTNNCEPEGLLINEIEIVSTNKSNNNDICNSNNSNINLSLNNKYNLASLEKILNNKLIIFETIHKELVLLLKEQEELKRVQYKAVDLIEITLESNFGNAESSPLIRKINIYGLITFLCQEIIFLYQIGIQIYSDMCSSKLNSCINNLKVFMEKIESVKKKLYI